MNRPALPFLGIAALAFGAATLRTPGTNWWLFAADGLGVVVVGGGALLVPWSALPASAVLVLPVAADVAVALLRDAQGGGSSGYSPLLILPVVWVGLTLGRREVLIMTACTALTFAVPLLVVGGPAYPATGWRGSVLATVVAGIVGLGANRVVGEQRTQAAAARTRARELDKIVETQAVIGTVAFDLDRVLDTVVAEAMRLAEADAAVVELPDAGDLVYRATAGTAVAHQGLRVRIESAISGPSLRTAETLICDDSENDPLVDREACRRVGARSLVVVPLLHDGRTIGVLKVYSGKAHAFADSTARVLMVLAGLIGTALVRADLMEELRRQAGTDELTSLPNRRAWYEHLEQALARARRSGSPLSVIVLDLDNLKAVNDVQGHGMGDGLLAAAARHWRTSVRDVDLVGRIGGDEFAIVLEDADADAVADVIGRLARPADPELEASAGAATWDRHESSAALVARADRAMYAQKEARKCGRADQPVEVGAV